MHYLLTLLAQICAVMAVLWLQDGQQYITDGYGLHPIVAGAAALSFLLLPYTLAAILNNRDRRQAACIAEGDDLIDEYQVKYGINLDAVVQAAHDKIITKGE